MACGIGRVSMPKCKACGAEIEWVKTPGGKLTPVNVPDKSTHWGTCPEANKFKKRLTNDTQTSTLKP